MIAHDVLTRLMDDLTSGIFDDGADLGPAAEELVAQVDGWAQSGDEDAGDSLRRWARTGALKALKQRIKERNKTTYVGDDDETFGMTQVYALPVVRGNRIVAWQQRALAKMTLAEVLTLERLLRTHANQLDKIVRVLERLGAYSKKYSLDMTVEMVLAAEGKNPDRVSLDIALG